MAEPYLFPVSILKDIEPWLTEYFAYQRFHIQPEIEQAFEAKYHRVEDFLKVNNEHINHIPHIHLAECDNQLLLMDCKCIIQEIRQLWQRPF